MVRLVGEVSSIFSFLLTMWIVTSLLPSSPFDLKSFISCK